MKTPPGPEPKLTKRQMAQLRGTIIGQNPRQYQLDFALWTRDLVREVIERKFGVTYTRQGVGKLLRRLGLSPQRPLVRAWEQDPERVRRWKEEEYPAIHAEAVAAGAAIFFADEAGVRTDCHAGTTWAPVGHTPIIKGTGKRLSVNMISAVSAQGKMHFSFLEGNTNAATFIDYLKKLLHDIPGKIFLVVDGHSAHTATETKKYVASTEGRLRLFCLPPYSPERGPRRMGVEEHQKRPRRQDHPAHQRRAQGRHREGSHPSRAGPGDRLRFLPGSRPQLHPSKCRSPVA